MPRYVLAAMGVYGREVAREERPAAPSLTMVAAYGDLHGCDYVTVSEGEAVGLYARDLGGTWDAVSPGTDAVTADEMRLWFELTHHYPGPDGADPNHPLGRAPQPGAVGRIDERRAITLVQEHIATGGLDYPVQGLAADRFAAGWSVYAPVDVDDSDPMAFLDMPVGRSVFMVGDTGRIKEVTSAIPPGQAHALFTAEEAFVRRPPAEEAFMNDLKAEFERLDARSGQPGAITDFTVVGTPPEEMTTARVTALTDEIARQLALCGPQQWERMVAVFSCAVSAETADLCFWQHEQPLEARVPEQIAVLVRRQRHLAAAMPAGPWLRLMISVTKGPGGQAQVSTQYDYGDERLPEGQLLAPTHYRNDLAAYPRAGVPAWLRAYAGANGRRTASPSTTSPSTTSPRTAPPRSAPPRPEAPERPFVDSLVGWTTHVVADSQRITYGRDSLAWEEIEWVRYPVSRTKHLGFLIPSTYTNTYTYGVGRYGDSPASLGNLTWSKGGKRAEAPEGWLALVEFAQRVLEPRLLAERLDLIRRGGSFTIGEMRVHRDGLTLRGVMDAAWGSLADIEVGNGLVSIHERGRQQPVRVSLGSANAVLLPRIVAAMAG
ncbi:hypothetical protein [Streptomyces xanthii]|uniref:Uncharacterized protein n=1 Tax=Streptomyces xanthii TaxID=2768069 RepID=A0A7H1B0C8_9ACTN|nr:hypothetical protein [Streptomyces xanthii]QNS02183.1 hypothetical protein IAG42_00170 [Streptomyces xanthii]